MKFKSSLPYPVLSNENDDYNDSLFDVQIVANKTFGKLVLEIKFELDNPGLQSLIDKNKAIFAVHIECSLTSYRKVVESKNKTFRIEIEEKELRRKIDIHTFILAKEKITDYTNKKWNPFYKGVEFVFDKGNVLAFAKATEIILYEEEIEYQNIPSIVTIRRDGGNSYVRVELTSSEILVLLPDELYRKYAEYGESRLKDTILSMVILPTLIDVFYTIKISPSDYEECRWYEILVQIFENNNHSFERVLNGSTSVIEAAQLVLRNPLVASFREIDKFLREGD